jgi:hypothetical protein
MNTPFSSVLSAYRDRFGRPRPDVMRMLTGQQRVFTDTVSNISLLRDAALFMLAHAARQGFPVAVFAPLMGMVRLEWRLQELGAPEGSVCYIHEDQAYAPAELALVYRRPINPILVSWPVFIR